jgi:hypothetical protein
MGVSEAAVSPWRPRARAGGRAALQHRSSPGAPHRLSAKPLERWPELLPHGAAAAGCRGHVWPRPRGREHASGMWRWVSSGPWPPLPPHAPVASPNVGAPGTATRCSGPRALAPRHLACDPKGAQSQPQALWFIDAAGGSPRPHVVCTSAPVGHTPPWRPWGTRAQLSAIGARSRAAWSASGVARRVPAVPCSQTAWPRGRRSGCMWRAARPMPPHSTRMRGSRLTCRASSAARGAGSICRLAVATWATPSNGAVDHGG